MPLSSTSAISWRPVSISLSHKCIYKDYITALCYVQILSNGKYKSVLHRTTVKKDMTRMSWPVFLEPPPELAIGPLPKLTSEDNPPKYKKKRYCDYVYCKLNKIPQ